MDIIEKGYTKTKYRRKIPKVGRSYHRHIHENKTIDKARKSINDYVADLYKDDKIPGGLADGRKPSDFDKKALAAGIRVEMEHTSDKRVAGEIAMDHLTEDPKYYEKLKTIENGNKPDASGAGMKKSKSLEHDMSIETEIEKTAENMEKSTMDYVEETKRIIKSMTGDELKKAVGTLTDDQKGVFKTVLEDMTKAVAMDAKYDGTKKEARLKDGVTEQSQGNDDDDEKLVLKEAAKHSHQGDLTPEGRDDHVIKSGESAAEEKKEKKEVKKIAAKEADKEVDAHEGEMHEKEAGMKKSLEELRVLKAEIVKSYEDAGLAYNDELIKAEMRKKLLKEEDQVKMGGQDKGGKKDRADKPSVPEIEVGKQAVETADEVKIKKSVVWESDQKLLKACTGGRNHHFSINAYYEGLLKKSGEKPEDLKKSEEKKKEDYDINDIIEKGIDESYAEVLEKARFEKTGKFTKNSFSEKDMNEAMGVSEEDLKEIK